MILLTKVSIPLFRLSFPSSRKHGLNLILKAISLSRWVSCRQNTFTSSSYRLFLGLVFCYIHHFVPVYTCILVHYFQFHFFKSHLFYSNASCLFCLILRIIQYLKYGPLDSVGLIQLLLELNLQYLQAQSIWFQIQAYFQKRVCVES